MQNINYTEEQIKKLQNSINDESDYLYKNILHALEPPKPSPLKSVEMQEQERNETAIRIMRAVQEHIAYGVKSFKEECVGDEIEKLGNIFDCLLSNINQSIGIDDSNRSLTNDDWQFLENIAKRKLAKEHYKEASSMFQLIIMMNMPFSPAWVGWAIAEQELGHFEVVENIFHMAEEIFPNDCFIALFAADFYMTSNKIEKAITTLEKAKELLIAENMQNSKSFEEVQKNLYDLKKSR